MRLSVLRRVFERRAALGFLRSHSTVSGGSAASIIARPPMLLLSHTPDDSAGAYKLHGVGGGDSILNLEKKRCHDLEMVGSAHGWIALHNRRNDGVLLSNPLSGQHVKLPPLPTLPDPLGGGGVSRLALSDSGHRAVIVAGRAKRLAFCEPGRSTEWTQIGEDLYCGDGEAKPREYEDAVYSRRHKRFYCVTRVGTEVEGWSLENPQSPEIEWRAAMEESLRPCPEYDKPLADYIGVTQQCWNLKYMVFAEERDELFVVVRHVNPRLGSEPVYYSKYRGGEYCYPYKTHSFDVYRIHLDGVVEYLEDSLDGLAMVVGMSQSTACEATAASALQPDSVYFSDERRLMRLSLSDVHNAYGGHDNGIFDYKSKSFSPCNCSSHDCPLAPALAFWESDYYRIVKRIDPPPLWLFI